jgi:hypothetical protein
MGLSSAPQSTMILRTAIGSLADLGQGERAQLVAGHEASGDGGEADGVAADLAPVGIDGGRGVAIEELIGHGAETHHQPVAGGELVAEQRADEIAALGIGESAGEVEDAGLLGKVEGAGEGGQIFGVGGVGGERIFGGGAAQIGGDADGLGLGHGGSDFLGAGSGNEKGAGARQAHDPIP